MDADLSDADLSCRYDLDGVSVRIPGARVNRANFEGATLRRTGLTGTDLSGAEGLSDALIEDAETDEKTIFPAYLRR
jgi:uncharacterized protein YjbI with pentapeptide repeats